MTQRDNPSTSTERGENESTSPIREKVGQIAETAKDTAQRAAGQAKEQVEGTLATQKDRAAEGLGSVAQALRQTGENLEGGSGTYLNRAADQIERLSGYLGARDIRDLVGQVESFARREPVLFLGGAFALGLLGARFLKASGRQMASGDEMAGYGDAMEGSYQRRRVYEPAYGFGPSYRTEYERDPYAGADMTRPAGSSYGTTSSGQAGGTGSSAMRPPTGTTGSGIGSSTGAGSTSGGVGSIGGLGGGTTKPGIGAPAASSTSSGTGSGLSSSGSTPGARPSNGVGGAGRS
jgi:hypothetical protein